MPYIHFMNQLENGVVTSREDEISHGGVYAVPVKDNGELFEKYSLEYREYFGNGKSGSIETVMVIVEQSMLKTKIRGKSLVFKTQSKPTSYIGNEHHPDFQFNFVILESFPKDSLDRLFEKHGICVIGCISNFNS